MTTLMLAKKTLSSRRMNCTAQCYDAKGPQCFCVCDGRNHGVGLKKAVENTKQMMAEGKTEVVFNEKVIDPKPDRDARGRFVKKGGEQS